MKLLCASQIGVFQSSHRTSIIIRTAIALCDKAILVTLRSLQITGGISTIFRCDRIIDWMHRPWAASAAMRTKRHPFGSSFGITKGFSDRSSSSTGLGIQRFVS